MDITDRQYKILSSIISEYVKTALPVSSGRLEKRGSLGGISSATIRNEMQELTKKGLLIKPHLSSGRIPSDHGYRLFVDRVLNEEEDKHNEGSGDTFSQFAGEYENVFDVLSFAIRMLSMRASSLAIAHISSKQMFWQEGWEGVLRAPEFQLQGFALRLAKFLHDFEAHIDELELQSNIHVFIGREVVFSKMSDFSLIVARYELPKKEQGTIALVGPKRMAYDSNIVLMESLHEFLRESSLY